MPAPRERVQADLAGAARFGPAPLESGFLPRRSGGAGYIREAVPKTHPALAKLRKIVAAWPETDERLSHGAPTFWGGKKTFANVHVDHHGDGRVAIWCKASFEQQADWVAADPETFFVPPYVGPSGWVGIRVDRKPDWALIEEILEQGYRQVAPKRAIAKLDGR